MSLISNSLRRGLWNGYQTISQSKLAAIGSIATASLVFGTGAILSRFGYPYRFFHSVCEFSEYLYIWNLNVISYVNIFNRVVFQIYPKIIFINLLKF